MSGHIFVKPSEPTYIQKGLNGYQFPITNKEVEVYFVNVEKGHDNYIISKKITHMYYIIEGDGTFDITGEKHIIREGMFVEVPPNLEYTFSGTMKLILIMFPPWFEGNEEITRNNPDVI